MPAPLPTEPAEPEDSCDTCRFYRGGNVKAAAQRGVPATGRCLRYPRAEQKQAHDWCGEYEAP